MGSRACRHRQRTCGRHLQHSDRRLRRLHTPQRQRRRHRNRRRARSIRPGIGGGERRNHVHRGQRIDNYCRHKCISSPNCSEWRGSACIRNSTSELDQRRSGHTCHQRGHSRDCRLGGTHDRVATIRESESSHPRSRCRESIRRPQRPGLVN
ncbi:hypothetical protein ABW18_00795 [Gordonia jacobaea]|uniref:Uncharacterized protein n=1 Tax=Gordonia jacobaea TaxID=122202 RepID=A0ABR5IH28_9ACTN|nr:hypothetical protein ABW18_00795 [Gordonia jacobaea]